MPAKDLDGGFGRDPVHLPPDIMIVDEVPNDEEGPWVL
jgi:hypothetical protein